MGDTEKRNIDLLRNNQTLTNHHLVSNSNLGDSQLNLSRIQDPVNQNLQNLFSSGSENGRRVAGIPSSHPQIPPISPYSQIAMNRPASQQMNLQSFGHIPFHSRSLSQPHAFNFNPIPHVTSSSQKDAIALPRSENHDSGSNPMLSPLPPSSIANRDGLPPRKLHRRSMSDVPFGVNNGIFQSPPLPPVGPCSSSHGGLLRTLSGDGSGKLVQLAKKESEMKLDGESMDDLLRAYMNLDNNDLVNYGGATEKNDSENSKTRGSDNSDNDAESSANESGCSGNLKDGLKRSAGGDITPAVRHQRSISMDSFMGKLQLNDDSPNLPSSVAGSLAEHSRPLSTSMFSGSELEKIMANEKLAEIAVNDPKRVKRILANRQSAARSKERKTRYITELEHKVQTLQIETTTLSSQMTMLQNDFQGLTAINTELKLRLLAKEQQAQLRNALHDALTKEIQHLRILNGEVTDQTRGLINFQMLQQQIQATSQQEPSSSTVKSESNSSHE
ncbi:hypothetical protein V2J09_002207 [Rumex salicifolius]